MLAEQWMHHYWIETNHTITKPNQNLIYEQQKPRRNHVTMKHSFRSQKPKSKEEESKNASKYPII